MIRGYGYQGGASPTFSMGAPGFGKSYKEAVRNGNGPPVSGFGPNAFPGTRIGWCSTKTMWTLGVFLR